VKEAEDDEEGEVLEVGIGRLEAGVLSSAFGVLRENKPPGLRVPGWLRRPMAAGVLGSAFRVLRDNEPPGLWVPGRIGVPQKLKEVER